MTGLHTRFLRRLIATPENAALRGDHAFIIAQPRPGQGFVDDFAIGQGGRWDRDGAARLVAAWRQLSAAGCQSMRVVTAHADTAKSHLLSVLSLRLTEQWWVRELTPATPPSSRDPSHNPGPGQGPSPGPSSDRSPDRDPSPGRICGTGFSGIFGPAPPVYDPGGPVVDADRLADDADLAAVADEVAALGAVLLIVPAAPGTPRSAELRAAPGWSVASDWYEGQPAAS